MLAAFKNHWAWVTGIIFIFLGLTTLLVVKPTDLVPKILLGVLTEVGFALLIAVCVAKVIEKGARQENDRYTLEKAQLISRNVFAYLYSVHFPKSAFSVLQDFVFGAPIIKTYQKLDYELLDPTDRSGWVKMRCEFDYTLRNLSDKVIEHPIRFYTSEVSGGKAPEFPGLGLQSLVIENVAIDPSRFPDIDKASADDVGEKKYEVVRTLLPNVDLRVRVTFVQVKKVEDNDLWLSNSVCEGLELKFRYNPEVYNVFLKPVHPADSFDTDIKPTVGDPCWTVGISRALLPKNGVFMWWNLRQGPPGPERTKATIEAPTQLPTASRL
jgi:hypothetical protein